MDSKKKIYGDTHCHLDMPHFEEDLEEVLSRIEEAELGFVLTLGTDCEDSRRTVELIETYGDYPLYGAVGVHPHDAKTIYPAIPDSIKELGEHPRVIAIGETGLDYYYDNSPRPMQIAMFKEHILWAREVDKPVVIHVRDAWEDSLQTLEENLGPSQKGILHCFSGNAHQARRALDMGLHISLGGPLTWKKNDTLREVVSTIPPERLLCETDAPYLAPVPKRGKRNEPAYVRHVYTVMAKLLGMEEDDLALQIRHNTQELFPTVNWERAEA